MTGTEVPTAYFKLFSFLLIFGNVDFLAHGRGTFVQIHFICGMDSAMRAPWPLPPDFILFLAVMAFSCGKAYPFSHRFKASEDVEYKD